MTALANLFIRIRNLVVAEVPFWIGVVIAAVNTSTDRTPKGYVAAAAIASLHFVVSPAFEQAALKVKLVDPKFVNDVEKALAAISAREAVATAFASDSFNGTGTDTATEVAPVDTAPPA